MLFSRFTRYFLEVARVGSIRKASESLNVSASAINRQILAAEEMYGVPLFERVPSGLKLTAAGELLLATGVQWEKDVLRLRQQINDLVGVRRGHVKIAIIEAMSRGSLPTVVGELQTEYPGITIELLTADNVVVQNMIEVGDVDLGIALSPRLSRMIEIRGFADVALGFVTLPGHPLASNGSARFNHCDPYDVVLPSAPLALHDQVAALEAATGYEIKPKLASNNIQMLKSLVLNGSGISILTSLDVAQEIRAEQLAFIPLSDPFIRPMSLALCTSKTRQLTQAATVVVNRLERMLSTFAK
jgi:DNA-binding transcriptional LysR family regulator